MSFGPKNAILEGNSSPLNTTSTLSSLSKIVGSAVALPKCPKDKDVIIENRIKKSASFKNCITTN
jgi:hypothetical protein